MKPRLLSVFAGSLKGPALTLSHHLEASPTNASESSDWINCKKLSRKKTNKKIKLIVSVMINAFSFTNNWFNIFYIAESNSGRAENKSATRP